MRMGVKSFFTDCFIASLILGTLGSGTGCVNRVAPPVQSVEEESEIDKEVFLQIAQKSNPDRPDSAAASDDDSVYQHTLTIFPGDELTISIFEKLPVSMERRVEMKRVDTKGYIFMLPIGEIRVAGLSKFEAEELIENLLEEYVVSPHVEIDIADREKMRSVVYIFGEVAQSGAFPLRPGYKLLDLLSDAGGCNDNAYRRSVKVIRVSDDKVRMASVDLYEILNEGKVQNNMLLDKQDIVFVPRRFYTNFNEVISIISRFLPWYYFVQNFTTF
jgi:polysaccharide export outer membrane protein